MALDPLDPLSRLPGVAAAIDQTREACTALRWHPALRRRTAEAQAETLVRAARATAALDGAEMPLAQVRKLLAVQHVSSIDQPGFDPVVETVRRALRVTMLAAELGPVVALRPAQALARLHLAAAEAGQPPEGLGRPRASGVAARDLVGLGAAPQGAELSERLDVLFRLVADGSKAPALILAAVVHGELLVLRPFPTGNGLVARAVARAIMVSGGLDPTGVAVPEVGLLAAGPAGYIGSAAGYGSGTPEGVGEWIRFCAQAMVVGAREGALVADAVMAGRLPA